MKPALAVVVLAISFTFANAQQQTETQKFLMERAKKALIKGTGELGIDVNSANYLAKRRAGLAIMEEVMLGLKENQRQSLIELLKVYEDHIAVEDVPDKMIPAFVLRMESVLASKVMVDQATEFGKRGLPFMPALEKLRDRPNGRVELSDVIDAINKIKNAK